MEEEKFNLVNEDEVESKNYEELLKLHQELVNNPQASDLDIAFVRAIIIDREQGMGIDNTIPWEKAVDELLKGTEFENSNRKRCTTRVNTNQMVY